SASGTFYGGVPHMPDAGVVVPDAPPAPPTSSGGGCSHAGGDALGVLLVLVLLGAAKSHAATLLCFPTRLGTIVRGITNLRCDEEPTDIPEVHVHRRRGLHSDHRPVVFLRR